MLHTHGLPRERLAELTLYALRRVRSDPRSLRLTAGQAAHIRRSWKLYASPVANRTEQLPVRLKVYESFGPTGLPFAYTIHWGEPGTRPTVEIHPDPPAFPRLRLWKWWP